MKLFLFIIFLVSVVNAVNVIQVPAPMPGFLFKPNDNVAHPAVIFLHGSEGGNSDYWFKNDKTGINGGIPQFARKFAELGYVVYSLCYFDCRKQPGYKNYPPDELINVDLMDVTYKAMIWLKKSPMVKNQNVSIMGFSRGAEHVLFFESLLLKLKKSHPGLILPNKVISVSPYQTTVSGIPLWWAQKAKETGVQPPANFNLPAWKFLGQSFVGGIAIDIRNTTIPTLITGFQTDPVWGNANLSAYRNQFPGKELLAVEMTLQDTAQAKFASLPPQLPKVTVLEYKFSGHSRPKETEPHAFFLAIVHKFLQQN